MVEIVMMLPILLLISLGVFDVGLGWRASMTLSNGTRAGARVITSLGTGPTADKAALSSVAAALADVNPSEIERVVIYQTTSADGEVPVQCLTAGVLGAGGSVGYRCNVYSAAELFAAPASALFTGNCVSSRDRFYCPTTRVNTQSVATGPDYVGVYVRLNHATKTKIFGQTLVLEDHTVMRIEPNAGNGATP